MSSKFCIVVPGASWGDQPGRIWDCLIRETIPIMKRSHSDWWQSGVEQMVKMHGLPIIFVDDWDEIGESIFDRKIDTSMIYEKIHQQYWNDFILRKCAL